MNAVTELATAVLAWIRHDVRDAPPWCLIVRLDLAAVDVVLCTVRSGLVSVVDSEAGRPQKAADRRLTDPRGHRGNVLRQVARSERHWIFPLYDDHIGPVRAGELVDAFTPYAAVAAGTVRQLLARHTDLDRRATGCVLVGELRAFPLATDLLIDVLQDGGRLLGTDRSGPDAVERGTALLATGTVCMPERYPLAVAVRTRAIRAGRLVDEHTVVAPAHTLGPSGATDTAARSGVVTVDRADCRIALDVLGGADGPQPVDHRAVDPPPPGRYTLGLRLVEGVAELVFRPEDPGIEVIRTIGELPCRDEVSR